MSQIDIFEMLEKQKLSKKYVVVWHSRDKITNHTVIGDKQFPPRYTETYIGISAHDSLTDAKKTRDASKHRLEREIMDLDNFVRVKGIANLKVERALNENKERN